MCASKTNIKITEMHFVNIQNKHFLEITWESGEKYKAYIICDIFLVAKVYLDSYD